MNTYKELFEKQLYIWFNFDVKINLFAYIEQMSQ